MADHIELIAELGARIEEWRRAPPVLGLARELTDELFAGTEPFVGCPLPEDLQRGRLPAGISSAWVFVLRPRTRNPAHMHPNSTQYTAVIEGRGTCYTRDSTIELELFDSSRPEHSLLVFPTGAAHAFEPGDEPLVVLSFHTVPPEALVEIEVANGDVRHYVQGSSAT